MATNYKVLEDIYLTYNVGRDGIGQVEQHYSVGEIIEGWVANQGTPEQMGKIVTNAVYTSGGKHYFTRIHLDPSKLQETTELPEESDKVETQITGVKQVDGFIDKIKKLPRKQKIGYSVLAAFILLLIIKRK